MKMTEWEKMLADCRKTTAQIEGKKARCKTPVLTYDKFYPAAFSIGAQYKGLNFRAKYYKT